MLRDDAPRPALISREREAEGKVFSLHFVQPTGLCRSRPQVREDLAEWDSCLRCVEFDSCYRLCMARLALRGLARTSDGQSRAAGAGPFGVSEVDHVREHGRFPGRRAGSPASCWRVAACRPDARRGGRPRPRRRVRWQAQGAVPRRPRHAGRLAAGAGGLGLRRGPPARPGSTPSRPLAGKLRPDAVVVSLAPKVSIARLSEALGGFGRVARTIPNAPSLVGAGFNPVAFGPGLPEDARRDLLELLGPLGACPVVPGGHLEAYAVLTAMGPTYLWFQLQQLRELGRSFGLPAADVDAGLAAMATGAARTLFASGLSAEEVMDLVPVRPLRDDEEAIRTATGTG